MFVLWGHISDLIGWVIFEEKLRKVPWWEKNNGAMGQEWDLKNMYFVDVAVAKML